MGEGQADERAPRERVRVRAPLAGQVRQEQEPVAARRGPRRRADEVVEGTPGAMASRNQRRLPAAESITDIRCQRPGHGVAEGVHPAARLEERPVGRREDDARGAERQGHRARPTAPTPTALAAWSPPPATTGVPARRPVAAAAAGGDEPGHLRALEGRRHPGRVDPERGQHLRRPVAGGEVEQQRAGAVGLVQRVARRSAGAARSPWAAARGRPGPRRPARGRGPRPAWAR